LILFRASPALEVLGLHGGAQGMAYELFEQSMQVVVSSWRDEAALEKGIAQAFEQVVGRFDLSYV
jgi:hypothetical protein